MSLLYSKVISVKRSDNTKWYVSRTFASRFCPEYWEDQLAHQRQRLACVTKCVELVCRTQLYTHREVGTLLHAERSADLGMDPDCLVHVRLLDVPRVRVLEPGQHACNTRSQTREIQQLHCEGHEGKHEHFMRPANRSTQQNVKGGIQKEHSRQSTTVCVQPCKVKQFCSKCKLSKFMVVFRRNAKPEKL